MFNVSLDHHSLPSKADIERRLRQIGLEAKALRKILPFVEQIEADREGRRPEPDPETP